MPGDRSKLGLATFGEVFRTSFTSIAEGTRAAKQHLLEKWREGQSGLALVAPFLLIAVFLRPLGGSAQAIPVTDEDLSAAVLVAGNYLLLGSDEEQHLFVLLRTGQTEFAKALDPIRLPAEGEIDVEAIAAVGTTVYVAGSHSIARKRVDDDRTQEDNRERITKVTPEESRKRIFRIDLDPVSGKPHSITHFSLTQILEQNAILGPFTSMASKENGVDIEGLAVKGDELYVGFRSPVLRENIVPVLKTSAESPTSGTLLFLDLDGLGVRDLVALENGFLVLAGPSNEAPGDAVLYYWTGEDALPGEDRPSDALAEIARIKAPENGGAAEGVAILASKDGCHNLLVVFDGPPGGAPQKFDVCTPR